MSRQPWDSTACLLFLQEGKDVHQSHTGTRIPWLDSSQQRDREAISLGFLALAERPCDRPKDGRAIRALLILDGANAEMAEFMGQDCAEHVNG